MFSRVRSLLDVMRGSAGHHRDVLHKLQGIEFLAADALRSTLLSHPRYQDPRQLARHGFRAYSQYEEDGMLDEIFRRVGTTDRFFVEFGVGDGLENNSAYRLASGWRGVWLDGAPRSAVLIREAYRELLSDGRLAFTETFITAETIERLFADARVPTEFDLLSIDIDGNDYWVWEAISRYRPRVVVVEYNAGLGPTLSWVMPYRADHVWDGSRAFGASLTALEALGRAKGYSLVGCGLNGVNAFFVRADLTADRFLTPFDSRTHFEPPRYRLLTFPGHPPSHKEVAAIAAKSVPSST